MKVRYLGLLLSLPLALFAISSQANEIAPSNDMVNVSDVAIDADAHAAAHSSDLALDEGSADEWRGGGRGGRGGRGGWGGRGWGGGWGGGGWGGGWGGCGGWGLGFGGWAGWGGLYGAYLPYFSYVYPYAMGFPYFY
jgi:hypothetical protein